MVGFQPAAMNDILLEIVDVEYLVRKFHQNDIGVNVDVNL